MREVTDEEMRTYVPAARGCRAPAAEPRLQSPRLQSPGVFMFSANSVRVPVGEATTVQLALSDPSGDGFPLLASVSNHKKHQILKLSIIKICVRDDCYINQYNLFVCNHWIGNYQ